MLLQPRNGWRIRGGPPRIRPPHQDAGGPEGRYSACGSVLQDRNVNVQARLWGVGEALLPLTAYVEIAIKMAAYSYTHDVGNRTVWAVRAALRGGMAPPHSPDAPGRSTRAMLKA